ncbi:MAG: S8 family serine peptidase [Tannerellaceae bacterium]|jgi:subtilisin family serine protease|nr:S8 family serine peptidase [Tannerellaceae bacterium]
MKKLLTLISSFAFMLSGCVEDVSILDHNNMETEIATRASGQGDGLFYYNFDEKVYLTQRTDQIFLKFAPDATEEQFRAIAQSNRISQKVNVNKEPQFIKGSDFNTLTLEIPQSTDAFSPFKIRKEIVSAEYLLEYEGQLSAITDEFLVKIKEGTSHAQLQKLAEKNGCTVSEREWFGGGVAFVISVSKSSDLNAIGMANLFYETGLFESAAPNFFHFNILSSNDTHYSDQWNLKSTGQYGSSVDINVEQAWTITNGNANIKIAVIDSGVDLTHPDLQANLVAGYDATGRGSAGAYVYNNGYGSDVNNSHGTAVAGIIGAIQNGEGISGVAPNCKIIPIRAGYDGGIADAWAISALDWARTRADVINCSWSGGQANPLLTSAISKAETQGRGGKGCVIVFSSGNDPGGNGKSTVNYPASLSNVIAVGAISYNGMRKSLSTPDREQWGSNYGYALDVVAPGVLIPTTDIQGSIGINDDWAIHTSFGGNKRSNDYTTDPNYTAWFSGTSAAAPHVSGVAALVLSRNPNLTSQEVTATILGSAKKIGGSGNYPYKDWLGSRSYELGYGLLDAHAAVSRALPSSVPTPVLSYEPDYNPPMHWFRFYIANTSSYLPGTRYEWKEQGFHYVSSGWADEAWDSAWNGHPNYVHTGTYGVICRAVYNGVASSWSSPVWVTYDPPAP